MKRVIIEARVICPRTWKCLFLFEEQNISYQIKSIPLSEEIEKNIKTAKINEKEEQSYIFENLETIINKEEMSNLGWLISEIESYFIPEILIPIRFERAIKPLVYRELSNTSKLQEYRKKLIQSLEQYSKQLENNTWFNKKNFSYLDITISTAIAVLDYLGEIQWQKENLKELYHWYLRIKSKSTFKIILNETCPGMKAFGMFQKIDF